MAASWGPEISCLQSDQTYNVGADCSCWKWISYQGGLLANHTHNPQEESKKTIQIMLLIQLRIEKTRKCLILYFLSNYQSDRQPRPGKEMRNECWIVGCQIKTPGLLRLPCTAGLRWVLSSVSNHIKVFILFSIPIQQVQDRETGLPDWVEADFFLWIMI